MPRKQHVVTLTSDERQELTQLIRTGSAAARVISRARVLLHADTGARTRRMSDIQIADAVAVSSRTVARLRASYGARGLTITVFGQAPRRDYARKLDGAGEAKLIELACGPVPAGHKLWSLRLLSETLVELQVVDAIAPNTVRAVLKKTNSSPGWCGSGVCPAAIPRL